MGRTQLSTGHRLSTLSASFPPILRTTAETVPDFPQCTDGATGSETLGFLHTASAGRARVPTPRLTQLLPFCCSCLRRPLAPSFPPHKAEAEARWFAPGHCGQEGRGVHRPEGKRMRGVQAGLHVGPDLRRVESSQNCQPEGQGGDYFSTSSVQRCSRVPKGVNSATKCSCSRSPSSPTLSHQGRM